MPISLNTYLKLCTYLNSILSKWCLLNWKIEEEFYVDLLGGFSNSMSSAAETQLSLEKAVTSI